ncbi:class I SAM-dependent methyltransferase [soil metagenome]
MNSIKRFSDRVENYIKYRPGYPEPVISYLQENININNKMLVADIGSGTGISSELFLKKGFSVIGVEPNKEMREAGERFLARFDDFKSVNGTAENTGLDHNYIDLIIAGQAFHWFDHKKCKTEFKRILNPDGLICLMWNERVVDSNDFLKEYEDLIKKYGTDYEKIKHTRLNSEEDDDIREFFSPGKAEVFSTVNNQEFDFEGLKGRLLSSSYIPQEDNAECKEMIEELKNIFEKHKKDGRVVIKYVTIVYTGRWGAKLQST